MRSWGRSRPWRGSNARLFGEAATTFEAITRDPNAYRADDREVARDADAVSTDSLRAQQPFLVDFAPLGQSLAPATAELKAALPDINPAIEAGTRTLARTPSLNANLQKVMAALKDLSPRPMTNLALNALDRTVGTLNPMIRYLGPYVTVCNGWNYWWTYLSEHVSEATSFGFAQRALFIMPTPCSQQRRPRRAPPLPPTAASLTRRSAASSISTGQPTARRSPTRAPPTARPASADTR